MTTPWPVDRRRFLAGSAGALGAAVFGRLPLDLLAEQGAPPAAQDWDAGRVRHLLPAVSDSRLLLKASFDGPLSAAPTLRVGGMNVTGRMNDTAGRALAVLHRRPRAGASLRAVPRRSRRGRALRAVAALHVPGAGRSPRAAPDALLHLRGRSGRDVQRDRRSKRLPADRDPQPPSAAGAVVRARRGGRQRRSHLLGSAYLAGRERRPAQSGGPDLELRLFGVGVQRQQRGGDEGGGRPADRAGLRYGLPVHAHFLPAGRPRPLGERRGHRRHRQLPDPVVPAPARARHPAALLPRVPARRAAAGRPAVVGDERPRRSVRELRNPPLRQPDRDPALRRAAHRQPLRAERGLHRPPGGELAAR